jgi:hypothetical protein
MCRVSSAPFATIRASWAGTCGTSPTMADQYKGQEGKEPLVRAMLAQVFDWAARRSRLSRSRRAYGWARTGRRAGAPRRWRGCNWRSRT